MNLTALLILIMIINSELSDSESESESESSSASTTSDSESDNSSESEEEITDDYLQSLLQRARESAAAAELVESRLLEDSPQEDEEVLILDDAEQPCVYFPLLIKMATNLNYAGHFQNSIQEAYLRRTSRLAERGEKPVY